MMSVDEVSEAAQLFLRFYVEGTKDPAVREAFRDAGKHPGIHLRRPAVLEQPAEAENPEVSAFDEQRFAAGQGPESSDVPYVFVDRCPIAGVRFTPSGNQLHVEFLCIVDYPPEQFPVELSIAPSALRGHRVLLPTAFGQHFGAAEECLERVQEFLGVEASQLIIDHSVTLLSLEEFRDLTP